MYCTNFTLANVVEIVNLQEQATQSDNVKCGSCLDTNNSNKCREHFCLDCTRSHKNMKTLYSTAHVQVYKQMRVTHRAMRNFACNTCVGLVQHEEYNARKRLLMS